MWAEGGWALASVGCGLGSRPTVWVAEGPSPESCIRWWPPGGSTTPAWLPTGMRLQGSGATLFLVLNPSPGRKLYSRFLSIPLGPTPPGRWPSCTTQDTRGPEVTASKPLAAAHSQPGATEKPLESLPPGPAPPQLPDDHRPERRSPDPPHSPAFPRSGTFAGCPGPRDQTHRP